MSIAKTSISYAGNIKTCFHCGETVPENTNWTTTINGHDESMCCPGCLSVAQTIIDYGLADFYKNRNTYQKKANEILPDILHKELEPYDNPELQQDFTHEIDASKKEICLLIEGIVCPACIWLIETRLQDVTGVWSARGNYTTNRLTIVWDNNKLQLSKILHTISTLGYQAYPFNTAASQEFYEKERKSMLKRIGLAGLLGMQVMMIAFALYSSDLSAIQPKMKLFLYWLSLVLTTPVVIYSGKPFFTAAWRDIRLLRLGMDVPITLGISIAFVGSLYNTLSGQEHVYYDSVVMFIFLLLTGRYLEFMSRKQSLISVDSINKVIPAMATLVTTGHNERTIPATDLKLNDILLIRPGEIFPADGDIIDGTTNVDESIITGESHPLKKRINDNVIAGSVNIESPVNIRVTAVGENTVQAQICHLIEEGQQQKQAITILANRVAGWFIFFVLMVAGIVSWYWWHNDYIKWLPVTISVLVVTCPCALSLATPTAITAATSLLMKNGVAIKRSNCIENLTRITEYIFDKTGTLTKGKLQILKVECYEDKNRDKYHAIAAAMERSSEHPLAKTIYKSYWGINMPVCKNITSKPGYGLSAEIDDVRYFIGSRRYINENTDIKTNDKFFDFKNYQNASVVLLANTDEILCAFLLEDIIRPEAHDLITYLHRLNKRITMLSGDGYHTAHYVGNEIGITDVHAELNPEEKFEFVNIRKKNGAFVAVIGDGINDAPILACAHVSIAMGCGTDLAQLNADMILNNGKLENLEKAIKIAYRTLRVIRQNIIWAIAYNVIALPVAAAGLLEPWMAALGMSLSSLFVIGNASRLTKEQE